jgi:hypothetical protein
MLGQHKFLHMQKRCDLKQHSLAVITAKDIGLPPCPCLYEGNVNGQEAFSKCMEILKARIEGHNSDKPASFSTGEQQQEKPRFHGDALHLQLSPKILQGAARRPAEGMRNSQSWRQRREFLQGRQENMGQGADLPPACSKALFQGQELGLGKSIMKLSRDISDLHARLRSPKPGISKLKEDVGKRVLGF